MGKNLNKQPLIAEIKNRKIFEFKDIFVYIALAVLIIILFLSLIVFNNPIAQGFKVTVGDKTILSHAYGSTDFDILAEYSEKIQVSKEGENYLVKIIAIDGGYNILFVDKTNKSVSVKESDCPSKNCVHMSAITNAGAIYCAPRDLKIVPLIDGFLPPVTGGVS